MPWPTGRGWSHQATLTRVTASFFQARWQPTVIVVKLTQRHWARLWNSLELGQFGGFRDLLLEERIGLAPVGFPAPKGFDAHPSGPDVLELDCTQN
jgi:hypothetical protein